MISQSTQSATSIRASIVGAVLDAHAARKFQNLRDLKVWFVGEMSKDFLNALPEDDEVFASSAVGGLASVLSLVDVALLKHYTVEQFVGVLRATLPLTLQEIT